MTCAVCEHCPFANDQEKIIYEIHLTVNPSPHIGIACQMLGIKLIEIDMGEGIPTHLMTSSTFKGNDLQVMAEAEKTVAYFKRLGIETTRIKIETVPWHPKAASPSDSQYFECHIAVNPRNVMYPERLEEWCNHHNLHKSRNLMKKGDSTVQMYTHRCYCDYETFKNRIEVIKAQLKVYGAECEKVIIEFALYDSNVDMDNQWLHGIVR